MKSILRRIAIVSAVLGLASMVVVVMTLYILQSSWFKNKVRQQVIAQVEQASGGRVELGSFDYDWRTVTADFNHFVVHGKEFNTVPPLFAADRVRIGLKVISVFRRNIDIASIQIQRPQIDLVIAADGSTNLPIPRTGPVTFAAGVQALLSLKVRHFDLNDGVMQFNFRRVPLNLRGEDAFLLLGYDRKARRYDATFSSHELHIDSNGLRPFSGALEASGWLERDRVILRGATLKLPKSTVQASGTLRHFTHPVADVRLSANLDASDLTEITKVNDIGRGTLKLNGEGHYDELNFLTFQGKVTARDLEYRIESLDFKKVSLESEIVARRQDLQLTHLSLNALGSRFTGNAALRQGKELELNGVLHGLNTEVLATLIKKRGLPWSGIVSGPMHVRARVNRPANDLSVQSDLTIDPGSGAIPISGNLDSTYRSAGNVLELQKSSVAFANTRLSLSGTWGSDLEGSFDSSNLDDLNPILDLLGYKAKSLVLPKLLPNGNAHFDGTVAGPVLNPQVTGNLTLTRFQLEGQTWSQLRSHVSVNQSGIDLPSFVLDGQNLKATATGHVSLAHWAFSSNSALQVRGQFRDVDLLKLANSFSAVKLEAVRGVASGGFDLQGTVLKPVGNVQIAIANLDAYGERLNRVDVDATLAADSLQIKRGHMQAGPAELAFSATYEHAANSWKAGELQVKVDSNGFPLAGLALVHQYAPTLNAVFEIHGHGAARLRSDSIEPLAADGTVLLRNVTIDKVPYGNVSFKAATQGQSLNTAFSGNLQESHLAGSAQIRLTKGNPIVGHVHLDQIKLSTIANLVHPRQERLPFEGLLQGGVTFEGPLQDPGKMRGTIGIEKLEVHSAVPIAAAENTNARSEPVDLPFHNVNPVVIEYVNGVATVSKFEMAGRGSDVTVSGSVPLFEKTPLQVKVRGSVDLNLFELFQRNVRASGESLLNASIAGALTNPTVNGTLELKNGSLFSNDLPNGLTAVNGSVRFDRNRATIEKLTAQTGGGELSLGGFMSFGNGGPLVYRLEANAENVRVRYAGSISVTATSQLRLTGTSENSILSGTTTISRVIFNPNTDFGTLLSSSSGPSASPSNEKDFLTGLQFDVHVESAPNLQLSTQLSSDVEAEIDLRLRGTPERPILFGTISANQGDVRVFGTKYTINRGEINFVNPVKIEPVVDLDLQTQARGIAVDITISGTPGKFNINYRSDPPLQPRDIVALLTVGRTPDTASTVPNVSVTNDTNALQSGANTVLGQAIAPASNRLSKLFGITNIKIDPMVQGITNTPQARLTVEQQVSKQITVTYVTNLSQTSEQIFRVEWDFSAQYSLVALRDDNGEFGIDIQYRRRFK